MNIDNSRRGWALVLALGLGAAAVLMAAAPVEAQYFGRNKVQYQTFDFQVLHTPNFRIHYYPENEATAREVARLAERWHARLSKLLDHELEQPQPVILYATHPDFQQTDVISGFIGEGTQGVTEAFKQRVVMPVLAAHAETDHLLGHELVHAFQFEISGLGRAGAGIEQAARRFNVPLWFIEGMAEYLSLGPEDPHTAAWIRDAVLAGELPSIERMTRDPRVSPYRFGHALWAYIGAEWGDAAIAQLLKRTSEGAPFPEAFRAILGVSLDELSEMWHRDLRRMFLPLIAEKSEPGHIARALAVPGTTGGRIHLGPSLSPDGSQLVFLSDLGFIDIELHLADAGSGQVLRRLVRGPALDPHFQSLRFLSSSGTWSPDGRTIAFSALRAGSDELVLLDVERASRERQVRIPGVREITGPSWSPDGRTLVFTGMEGGRSNLYAVDLETGSSRRLTDDQFAALQPSFSPDGRRIAFVTDRPDEPTVHGHGRYRIAVLDLETARETAPGQEAGSSTNPVWTERGLLFISDRTGITNLYRVDLASGDLFQLTDLYVGATGVTSGSPALTASLDGSRIVFSVLEGGGFNLYALDGPEAWRGEPVARDLADSVEQESPARLAPPGRAPQEGVTVASLLADEEFGYPSASAAAGYEIEDYGPRLSLDFLSQPRAGIGVSTGQTLNRVGVGGGIAGVFSDMLGHHTVVGALDVQGSLDQTGFTGIYLNRRQRWNFGGAVQRLPFVVPAQRRVLDEMNGREVVRDQLLLFRFFDSRVQATAFYPFSQVQRIEFGAAARRISQDIRGREFISAVQRDGSGQIIGLAPIGAADIREPGGASLTLWEPSVALVYDNTLFGFTSPIAGQRYRLEVAPTLGTLRFTQLLADYRRYIFQPPFTLAFRGLHFGRYGSSADEFFQPLFLGFPSLIRGYGFEDTRDECSRELQGGGAGAACNVLPQLLGTRIATASAEVRFPLIGRFDLALIPAGLPPVEGIAFFDAGIAWSSETSPVLRSGSDAAPGEQGLFRSIGVGARVNMLGFFVLETNYVNPLDRPRGWHWQFSFQPGF